MDWSDLKIHQSFNKAYMYKEEKLSTSILGWYRNLGSETGSSIYRNKNSPSELYLYDAIN